MLSELTDDAISALASTHRLRVRRPTSPFSAALVEIVNVVYARRVASVRVAGGQQVVEERLDDLEVIGMSSFAGAVAAHGADVLMAAAKFKVGDYVKFVEGSEKASWWPGTLYVYWVEGDGKYTVVVQGVGKRVAYAREVCLTKVFSAERPAVAAPVPSPSSGNVWSPTQLSALTTILSGQNVFVTGPPGAGKTALLEHAVAARQVQNVTVRLMALSNSIANFLRQRLKAGGIVDDVDQVVGTFSSQTCAALGSHWNFENVNDLVADILGNKFAQAVCALVRLCIQSASAVSRLLS